MTTLTMAGRPVTREEVRGTIALLRFYSRFLASDYDRARNPEGGYSSAGEVLSKDDARARLSYLLDVAINRRAGIPDVPCAKAGSDWQVRFYRDQQRVHDRVRSRIRVYQFETRLAREAFGSLLSSYRDDD